MKNLVRDIKGHRPILISPRVATDYIKSVSDLNIPLTAKVSDMDEVLGAIFGKPAVLEKFPPFAIVPVKGVIGSKLSDLDKICGCCDIKVVEEMLEDCERDASISTIILDIDSPGGTSVGVPELAARIRGMSKKVISFTDSEACSAAYWLGSQASEFYATGSASVGSIGCYIAYEDESARYANEGVTVDVIRAGRVKGAGIAGTALSAEQREMLQGEVEEIWEGFKADVKAVREFVDDASMEGQIFSGKKAADAGLVTGLVLGFDEMMETLNADVAAQIEADEDNDERAESGEGEVDAKAVSRIASARALGKDVLKALSASRKMKSEDEEDEEDEDEEKSEDGEEKPESEEDDEKKSEPESEEDEDKDEKKSEDGEDEPKSEDDDEKKDEPASDDDEDEKEPESADDGEDEKGEPAQPSADGDEEKDDEEKSEDDEGIEEESESGDGPVDTDEKHNRKGSKRNKGRRIA